MDDVDSEDEEEDEKATARPYMALLQSFNESSAPKAKRRKLEHQEVPDQAVNESDSDEQSSEGSDEEGSVKDVDRVEEAEEDAAAEVDEEPEDDDSEDEEELTDPFDVHFAHADEDLVAKRVKAVQASDWSTKRALMQSWRATVMYPSSDSGPEVPKPVTGIDGFKLKQKLKETAERKIGNLDAVHRNLSPLIFDYRDVLHCDRSARNSEQLRQLTCLHALNHVFK